MGLSWLMRCLVLLVLQSNIKEQSHDISSFDFPTFNQNQADLIFQGNAHAPVPVNPSVPGGRISLTRAHKIMLPSRISLLYPFPNSAGRVLYSRPFRLWDVAGRRQANFQTHIRGLIGNSWGIPLADDISFFIAPVNTTIPPGSTGGHMGLYASSGTSPTSLFAVELDVSLNSWNPPYRHVGINVNSRSSLSVSSWQAATGSSNIIEVDVRIIYDACTKLISVLASGGGAPMRLERSVDLNGLLPESFNVGIDASTAEPDCVVHVIRAWSFFSFMVADQLQHT